MMGGWGTGCWEIADVDGNDDCMYNRKMKKTLVVEIVVMVEMLLEVVVMMMIVMTTMTMKGEMRKSLVTWSKHTMYFPKNTLDVVNMVEQHTASTRHERAVYLICGAWIYSKRFTCTQQRRHCQCHTGDLLKKHRLNL